MLDSMGALRSLVLDSAVLDLLGESADVVDKHGKTWAKADRVFVNRIPDDLIAAADTYHPPKIVVLRQGGGSPSADELPREIERVVVLCYGESQYEADKVRLAVFQVFKYIQRQTFDSVLIHHLTKAGGPVPLSDPDIVWPAVSQAYTFMADQEDAA